MWPPSLKTDGAPRNLLVLFDVTAQRICFRLPGEGSAQGPKKLAGCQIPRFSFSRHSKCQLSGTASCSMTQSWCKLSYPRFIPQMNLFQGDCSTVWCITCSHLLEAGYEKKFGLIKSTAKPFVLTVSCICNTFNIKNLPEIQSQWHKA